MCRCGANFLHCRSPLSLALSSASITWELIASCRRPAFSSHLLTSTVTSSTTAPFAKLLLFMRLNVTAARSVAVLLFSSALPVSAQAQVTENTGVSKTTPTLPSKVSVDVTPPRPVYTPEPEYSEEARGVDYQGTCVLWLIVDTDGKARNIRVARRLGMGLDEKAIEAVRRWTFEPARKNGRPVAFQINVEVSFRLSRNGLTNVLSPEQLDKVSEAQARARALAQSQIHRISEGRAPRS